MITAEVDDKEPGFAAKFAPAHFKALIIIAGTLAGLMLSSLRVVIRSASAVGDTAPQGQQA